MSAASTACKFGTTEGSSSLFRPRTVRQVRMLARWTEASAIVESIFVDLNVATQVIRYFSVNVYRVHWAHGFARSAIDTLVRMNVELSGAFKDTVDGTHIHTRLVIDVDTGFGNHVGHTITRS